MAASTPPSHALFDRDFAATATSADLDALLSNSAGTTRPTFSRSCSSRRAGGHGKSVRPAAAPASVNDCPFLVMPPGGEPQRISARSASD